MFAAYVFYHMIAFFLGFVLDLLLGDPYWLPHPVRWIGSWISYLEKKLNDETLEPEEARRRGNLMAFAVILPVLAIVAALQIFAYWLSPWAGIVLETIFTYQMFAARCLKVESMKVYKKAKVHDVEGARKAVSMLVSRNVTEAREGDIIRAAIESVAENVTDGEIGPMFYLAFFGPVGGFLQKTANTLDSMLGYRTPRYMYFGRMSARMDDYLNMLPARMAAMGMILAAFLLGKDYSGKNAWRIFKRDRFNTLSPNSGQTESVCAGALGIAMGWGTSFYFVQREDNYHLGDAQREVEAEDIVRANRLLYAVSFFGMVLFLAVLAVLWLGVRGAV